MSKQVRNSGMDRTRGIVDVLREDDVTKRPLLLHKYYAFDKWTQNVFENN